MSKKNARKTPIDRGTIGYRVFAFFEGRTRHIVDSEGRKGDSGCRKKYVEKSLPLLLNEIKLLVLGNRGIDDAYASAMPPRRAVQEAGLFLHTKAIGEMGILLWADENPPTKAEQTVEVEEKKKITVRVPKKPEPIFPHLNGDL